MDDARFHTFTFIQSNICMRHTVIPGVFAVLGSAIGMGMGIALGAR